MKHDERKEIFTKFNLDNSGILISTDVAARGLDFPNVEWVIHYDINPDLKEYVNRMGRTARLDNLGNSLLFIMENERELLYNSFNKIKGDIKEIVNSNIFTIVASKSTITNLFFYFPSKSISIWSSTFCWKGEKPKPRFNPKNLFPILFSSYIKFNIIIFMFLV